MREFADKLIEITESHAEEISREWCKAVRTNPRTKSYHSMAAEECFPHALSFYRNLRTIYFSEKPYKEVCDYFSKYAEERYQEGIPLQEAAYAIVMMRRHMWLYAEFQALFLTPVDHHRAIATINKTIRVFDQGLYCIIKRYGELSEQ
jgi:hypothetical protein